MDTIVASNLKVNALIGVDAWERIKKQPLVLTIKVYMDIQESGDNDDLNCSISYATIAKKCIQFAESRSFKSMESLVFAMMEMLVEECYVESMTISVDKPRGLLYASAASIEMSRRKVVDASSPRGYVLEKLVSSEYKNGGSNAVSARTTKEDLRDKITLKDLQISTIVGVNPWEREDKQRVLVNMEAPMSFAEKSLKDGCVPSIQNYRKIAKLISTHVENATFYTLEALAISISNILLKEHGLPEVFLSVRKPSALLFADYAGIEIRRSRSQLKMKSPMMKMKTKTDALEQTHSCYIAFGTNLGDRYQNILSALELLKQKQVSIVDTSFLYESSPKYVLDQPLFINGVIKAKTNLSPNALLETLKDIENELGRNFNEVRYGPRTIDLDILFYDDLELNTEKLVIPHPKISERKFVLQPLCDIAAEFEHPRLFRTCGQLLALLKHQPSPDSDRVYRVLPLGKDHLVDLDAKQTLVMGILNTTPDSFSDGGQYYKIESAFSKLKTMVEQGADIIDIGGQSTRPGADEVSLEVEISRVVPVIRAIRSAASQLTSDSSEEERRLYTKISKISISIDTYRASVAQAAIEAGADMVNDVTGADYDKDLMIQVVEKSKTPICLMHMRGNPKTMSSMVEYKDLLGEIGDELNRKANKFIRNGIYRWNIILDPGIGFAKNSEQNFDILKNLRRLVQSSQGMPLLVGVSRKGFIGKATGSANDPKSPSRVWGTAGACSAAVAGGAKILRVHDVKEMKDVISVADLCFR